MLFNLMISFEFFPPKTEKGDEKLEETFNCLKKFSPEYCSVTFGAGGSSQNKTENTVLKLKEKSDINIVPHISGICSSKKQIDELLTSYKNNGIDRLVVLRGDLPQQMPKKPDFQYASDLISYIKKNHDHFYMYIAAYPESHPQSQNIQKDFENFKNKISLGTNAAITQYFYNFDAFETFLDGCAKYNINIPIHAGIMPIYDVAQLEKFSDMCGADLPRWLRKKIEMLDEVSHEDMINFGIDTVSELCSKLKKLNVPLHFYTLNKHEVVERILKNIS